LKSPPTITGAVSSASSSFRLSMLRGTQFGCPVVSYRLAMCIAATTNGAPVAVSTKWPTG
jgi:hypothetical protein